MNARRSLAKTVPVILSYFLVVVTLPPFNVGYAALALLLPILFALKTVGVAKDAALGVCWGALVGSYMYWGAAAYSIPVFVLVITVVSSVGGLLFVVTGMAIRSSRIWVALLVPFPWVLSEIALNAVGIPYSVSVLLAGTTELLQPLKIGGQHFLAGCVYLFQTCVFLAITRDESRRLSLVVALVPAAIVVAASFVAVAKPVEEFPVAAVQTSSHPYSYLYMSADGVLEASLTQRDSLQSNVAPDVKLVVWPEWAVLGYQFRLPPDLIPTATGSQLLNAQDLNAMGIRRNLVAALNQDGSYLSVNGKAYLIPFIEQSFSPATRWNVHRQLPGSPLSTICYESVFPKPVADMVRDGAGLITILTSDAFAGPSLIPFLHSRYAILRAVESNRYAIRSANGGVSMIVSNRGEVLRQLPLFDHGVLNETVHVFNNVTPYTRYAQAWWWGLLLLSLASTVTIVVSSGRSTKGVRSGKSRVRRLSFLLLLTGGVGLLTVWGQSVYVSSLFSKSQLSTHSSAQSAMRYSLFFKDAYDKNQYSYDNSRASSANESLASATAYTLRSYGLPVTSGAIKQAARQSSEAVDGQLVDIRPIVERYGFSLLDQNIDTDTLTMPVIAIMNSGEAVVIENMTRQRVTLFSPVNGSIKLETSYFLERLATKSVMFIAPPARSWDE